MTGKVIDILDLRPNDIEQMYTLMTMFYENMDFNIFIKDLNEKQVCIILFDEMKQIQGFSTQKIISLEIQGNCINGVFSGDTIIHKNYQGSWTLFQLFARYFIEQGKKQGDFYWFLISKGYKTYKILPLFYKEFYPNYKASTPEDIQKIINHFGQTAYPEDFNGKTGVIEYKKIKDKLKPETAELKQKHLTDPDIAFFCNKNPGHMDGNDLVCLTRLTEDNLTQRGKSLLLSPS